MLGQSIHYSSRQVRANNPGVETRPRLLGGSEPLRYPKHNSESASKELCVGWWILVSTTERCSKPKKRFSITINPSRNLRGSHAHHWHRLHYRKRWWSEWRARRPKSGFCMLIPRKLHRLVSIALYYAVYDPGTSSGRVFNSAGV